MKLLIYIGVILRVNIILRWKLLLNSNKLTIFVHSHWHWHSFCNPIQKRDPSGLKRNESLESFLKGSSERGPGGVGSGGMTEGGGVGVRPRQVVLPGPPHSYHVPGEKRSYYVHGEPVRTMRRVLSLLVAALLGAVPALSVRVPLVVFEDQPLSVEELEVEQELEEVLTTNGRTRGLPVTSLGDYQQEHYVKPLISKHLVRTLYQVGVSTRQPEQLQLIIAFNAPNSLKI